MRHSLTRKVAGMALLLLLVLLVTAVAGAMLLWQTEEAIDDLTVVTIQRVLLNGRFSTALDQALLEADAYAVTWGDEHRQHAHRMLQSVRTIEAELAALEEHRQIDSSTQESYHDLHRRRLSLLDAVNRELDALSHLVEAENVQAIRQSAARLDELHRDLRRLDSVATTVFQHDVATTRRRLESPMRAGLVLCVGAAGLLVLLVTTSMLRILRNIVRPINSLSAAVQTVAAGSLDQGVPITDQDEIGVLQRAFNQMVIQLRERHHALVQRNDELKCAHDDLVQTKVALLASEERLRTLNSELEQRVAERTVALTVTNQKLEEREQQYRSVVDSIEEVIFQTDATGRWTFLNPAWVQITGFTVEESLGELCLNFIHPDDREHSVQRFSSLAAGTKEHCRHEVRYRTKDGGVCWVEARARLVLGPDEAILGTTGTLTDLTMRKLTEQVLRESEERFRQLAEHVQEVFFISSPRGDQMFYVSPAYEAIWGRSCTSLYESPRSWTETIHPLDQAHVAEDLGRLDGPQGLSREFRIVRPDGEVRWVRNSAFPIANDQGVVYRIVGTAEDITQRRQAEQALREVNETLEQRVLERTRALQASEERYRTLVERMSEGLIQSDQEDRIVFANDRLCEFTGYTRDELFGQSVFEFLLPTPADSLLIRKRLSFERPVTDQYEMQIRCKSGEQIWVQVGRSPLFNSTGAIAGAIMVYTDITERKQVEAALANERGLLAQRVAERTVDLSRANAELARAARLKDEFLASMSHELRTPLNTILGMTESLEELIYGPLTADQVEALRHIDESGRHLLTLINDILDLSKIEAGKLSLDLQPVDARAVCEASLRMIMQGAQQKRLQVSSQIDGAATSVLSEARRLKQILVNLLSNAVKFTPEGGALGLDVSVDQDAGVVRFTVWDTGIGIAPVDQERLFKPFVQLDSRLSRQFPGTGLGLALVYRIVDLHGGSIAMESSAGAGSRFVISLASGDTHETIDQEPAQVDDGPVARPPAGERPIILLVEDHSQNIETFSHYLGTKGYKVAVACNGVEALERAWEIRPDVILMDIQMPVLDGLEATRRLKASAELASIPVIALTGLSMPGDRERCMAAGADDYISKPASLKQLVRRIEALLERRLTVPQ